MRNLRVGVSRREEKVLSRDKGQLRPGYSNQRLVHRLRARSLNASYYFDAEGKSVKQISAGRRQNSKLLTLTHLSCWQFNMELE